MRLTRPSRFRTTVLVTVGVVALGGAGESLAAAGGPPTKAAATAFADAVNLRTGDIPGFTTGSVSKQTAADKRTSTAISRCAGGVDASRAVVDVSSPDFKRASGIVQQEITSDTEVLPSAALVAKDLRAVKSARGRGCLERAFQKGFATMKIAGVKFGKVSVATKSIQATGASGSFALRFTIKATIHGVKIPYYSDFVGFSLGQAEVSLTALGFGVPVPSTDELGLFSVLLRRAEAATLS